MGSRGNSNNSTFNARIAEYNIRYYIFGQRREETVLSRNHEFWDSQCTAIRVLRIFFFFQVFKISRRGYNGTQGLPGPPGPPGCNGTQSLSGSGNLALCSYKNKSSPGTPPSLYALETVQITEPEVGL